MSNIYASGAISSNPTQNVVLSRYAGKVGIGTSSPSAKLHVNGTVLMGQNNNLASVKVLGGICVVPSASQSCPDYVFSVEPDYELRSIEALENTLREKTSICHRKKSAKEIEKDGMNVVDMSIPCWKKWKSLACISST
ncbi:MAG: hypothetical protein R3B47_10735 [Bacteroidia bacterium]